MSAQAAAVYGNHGVQEQGAHAVEQQLGEHLVELAQGVDELEELELSYLKQKQKEQETAISSPETAISPLEEETAISQRVVEMAISQQVVETGISKRAVETGISQRAVETEISQRAVETEISQRAAEMQVEEWTF